MTRWLMWVSVALSMGACASAPPRPTSAPDFVLTALDGAVVTGHELWADDSVLLVFMASWCEACRAEVPALNALAASHRVIAIASGDTRDAIARTQRETGMRYPVLLDDSGDIASAYHIVASPTCVLVDRGGVERYRGHEPPESFE